MKKCTAIVLLFALFCGLFSGCAGKEEEAYVPTGDALLMEGQDPEEYLAGHKIYDFQDFFAFLESVCRGDDPYAASRRALTDRLFAHKDGQSCRRITEILGLVK